MAEVLERPDSEEKARAVVTGKVVETLRLRKAWSQSRLAHELGVGQATVSRLEAGNYLRPDAFLFRKIAEVFGLTSELLHAHIDKATLTAKGASKDKGDEWWKAIAIGALAGVAVFAIISILEGEVPKPPKVPK